MDPPATKEATSRLKPENIVNKPEEVFYICGICKLVVLDPKECSKCNVVYCEECIQKSRHQGVASCPKKCDDHKIVDLHRFVKNLLLNQVFKCDIENCEDEPLTYLKAIEHIKLCKFATTDCPHGCGAKVLNSDSITHDNKCPKKIKVCEECEFSAFVNIESFEHDCFQELRKQLIAVRKEKEELDYRWGTNYDVVNPECPKSHALKQIMGTLRMDDSSSKQTCSSCA